MDSTISSTSGGQDVIAFLKPLLVNRIFLGTYKERRYVTALRQYRYAQKIHSIIISSARGL